jgi:hypothetical protein
MKLYFRIYKGVNTMFLFLEWENPDQYCRDIAENKRDDDIGDCIAEKLFQAHLSLVFFPHPCSLLQIKPEQPKPLS